MEKQLFTWGDWDDDGSAFNFYQVTLIKDIKHLKAGERFSSARLDYGTGILQFYRSDSDISPEVTFELLLEVK